MNSILNFRMPHLSEQQIEDQLIGDLSAPAAAHLASCAPCTRRVAEASAPMAHFRAAATEWSERRSATMPPITPAGKPRWAQRFALGTATAALLAAAFAIPALHAPARSNSPSAQAMSPAALPTVAKVDAATQATLTAVSVPAPVPRAGQPEAVENTSISRDNQMLEAIDVALSAPAASPASLGLEAVSSEKNAPENTPEVLQD